MALPLLGPLRDLLGAHAGAAKIRAVTITATTCLAVVAIGLLVAAGLAALTDAIGFPAAALVFAALFAILAVAVHLLGRLLLARRAARIAAAQTRAKADLALAAALSKSAPPLLPLGAAFLAAFLLARKS